MDRLEVKQAVRACTNCSLYSAYSGPVPFVGPTPADIAIIAEAPGRSEDRAREPLVGVSGRLLRQLCYKYNIDWQQTARLNVVSCFPNRTPTTDEVTACQHNVALQLSIIQPKYMLVCGKVATKALVGRDVSLRGAWWRYDVRQLWGGDGCDRVRGQVADSASMHNVSGTHRGEKVDAATGTESQVYDPALGIWCLSTLHPAAVLRNPNLTDILAGDIELFRFYSLGVFDPPEAQFCIVCGVEKQVPAVMFKDWLGYCQRHGPKEKVEGARKVKHKVSDEQGRLV